MQKLPLKTRYVAASVVGLWLALMCQSSIALTEKERNYRISKVRMTIERVQAELEGVQSTRSGLQKELESSETEISELNKKIEELKRQLEDKQASLRDLREKKEALASVKKQQTQSASTHINAAYRLGNQSSMKLLLNQKSPSHVSRNLKYYSYIVKARNQKIQHFVDTITRLNELEPRIASDLGAIGHKKKALSQQQLALARQQKKRQKDLLKLDKSASSKAQQLAGLNKDRADLESLLVTVAAAAKHLPQVTSSDSDAASFESITQLKGQLPWPASGHILQAYNSERVKGKVRWKGVVIGAAEGSPVRAIHRGRVVFCDYLRGQGLLIIVDHGSDFMSLYAHNQSLYKALGDWVEGGEHIASVGASGGQKTANLYFELRFKGQPTNPQVWFKRA